MIGRTVTLVLVAMALGSGVACSQALSSEVLTFQNWKTKLRPTRLMLVGSSPGHVSIPVPPQILEQKDEKLCRFALPFDHQTGVMARGERYPATLEVFANLDCGPLRLTDFVSSAFPAAFAASYAGHLESNFWQDGSGICIPSAKSTSCDVYGVASLEGRPAVFRCHIWADDAQKGWVGGRNNCEVFIETKLGLTAVNIFYSHTGQADAYRDIQSRVARANRIAITAARSLSGEEITSWP